MDKVIIEFEAPEVQKIVEYLWKQPYGEVATLIEIVRNADQKALAKISALKAQESCSKQS